MLIGDECWNVVKVEVDESTSKQNVSHVLSWNLSMVIFSIHFMRNKIIFDDMKLKNITNENQIRL